MCFFSDEASKGTLLFLFKKARSFQILLAACKKMNVSKKGTWKIFQCHFLRKIFFVLYLFNFFTRLSATDRKLLCIIIRSMFLERGEMDSNQWPKECCAAFPALGRRRKFLRAHLCANFVDTVRCRKKFCIE